MAELLRAARKRWPFAAVRLTASWTGDWAVTVEANGAPVLEVAARSERAALRRAMREVGGG